MSLGYGRATGASCARISSSTGNPHRCLPGVPRGAPAIDFHFHDLGTKRVHGSSGWPIHHVSEMPGHSSLEQTSAYLNVTRTGLHESMRPFDNEVARCKPVANEAETEHRPVCSETGSDSPQPLLN